MWVDKCIMRKTLKCKKKRYATKADAQAFAWVYIEQGYTYNGYGVYKCRYCRGYHLSKKVLGSKKNRITIKTIGWNSYESILKLIDQICGVEPCEV